MLPMHTLRHAKLLARFMLVWFALSMGVAIASPLVKPNGVRVICSAAGVLKIVSEPGSGVGGGATLHHGLDCPLCAAVGTPPSHALLQALPPMGLAYVPPHAGDAPVPSRHAAAFAPRGPPAFA
jgi:hypothetical protein